VMSQDISHTYSYGCDDPIIIFRAKCGYFSESGYEGLHVIKGTAPLKDRRQLETLSNLWLTNQPRSGRHPLRLRVIRGTSRGCVVFGSNHLRTAATSFIDF